MEHKAKFVSRRYFQRLLIGLLVFIFLLQIPLSIAVLRTARKSVLNNINTSNQTVLEQLNKNYDSYASSISSLAASIFWRDDIQMLLHSPSVDYTDAHFMLIDLYKTFVVHHPDLHSICLYNKYNKTLYITTTSGSVDKIEFTEFVNSQDGIRPLQPILHSITNVYGSIRSSSMVFSHFMYQFNDPSQTNQSYLVLNQYADQAASTLDTVVGTSSSIPTTTFFVTQDAYISSKKLAPELEQAHAQLIDQFRQKRDELPLDGSCYQDKVNGQKYLLTYVNTKWDGTSLVIIQDYDTVFAELNTLSHRFYLIIGIFMFLAVLLAFFISQQLYKPINSVYDFIKENSSAPVSTPSRSLNELELIKNAIQSASEKNTLLQNRDNRLRPIALQYGISSLLLKNNRHYVEQFQRANPEHWLTNAQGQTFHIILLKPILSTEATLHHIEETDIALLLYGIQNVSEELLAPHYYYASFRQGRDTLGIIISPKATPNNEALTNALETTRNFIKEHFSVSVTAAVSNGCNEIAGLYNQLQDALTFLSYTFLFGPMTITHQMTESNETNNQVVYPAELDARLESAITSKDTDECKKILSELKTVLRQFNIRNSVICISALVNQVYRILGKTHSPSAFEDAEFPFATVYKFVSGAGTIDQAIDVIFNYIYVHLSGQNFESKTGNELFIKTVFELVQNSYSDYNLSSQLIADNLGLSNRYLMKKFKALSGIPLNEYITDIRLKMAAMFLRDTDAPISVIAENVGIDNLSYFYRLFKKTYGCTPKEYRANSCSSHE